MRIVGGHDFYDSALAYGHDETVVLVREKDKSVTAKEVFDAGFKGHVRLKTPHGRYYGDTYINRYPLTFVMSFHHVIIGDTLYKGLTVRITKQYFTRAEGWADNEHERVDHIWSAEVWEAWLARYGFELVEARKTRWVQEDTHGEYFTPEKLSMEMREWMIENRFSILVYSDRSPVGLRSSGEKWSVNPDGLKDIGFAKAIDPFTLFQELDMWNSSVLGMAANPMVEISDKMKVHKHGFDQFSFRKPKQKA